MTNETIATVQVISTVMVTLANIVLTVLTYRYVKLTGGMLEHVRSAQTAAVTIDLTFDGQSAYFNIANTGSDAATNVRFEKLTGLEWSRRDALKEVRDRGISYLPAGRTLRFWLGHPDWRKVKEQPVITVSLAFEAENRTRHREFIIDMMQYAGATGTSSPADRIIAAIDGLVQQQRDRDSQRNFDKSLNAMFGRVIDRPSKKACLECAELIPSAAKRCSHCRAAQSSAVADDVDLNEATDPLDSTGTIVDHNIALSSQDDLSLQAQTVGDAELSSAPLSAILPVPPTDDDQAQEGDSDARSADA